MTILFFTRLFHPSIGGVEKHVLEVGKRLKKRGYRVIVVTEQIKPRDAKSPRNISGIRVYRIPVGKSEWWKKFTIWSWLLRNRKLIKDADIVHCHDVFFWYLPLRFLYPGKKVYTTFHGYETKFPPAKKAVMLRKVSEVLSHGNICVGDYIRKWYGTKPNFVTYGGIDQVKSEKLKIKSYSPSSNTKLNILFIGRLENDTGIVTYLETLRMLKKRGIAFSFEVCGDGSYRKEVQAYGKVHGFMSNLKSFITKADIIFSTSYLSILESLAQGKTVFAVYANPLKKDYLKMAPFARWVVIKNSAKILAKRIEDFGLTHSFFHAAQRWLKKETWDTVTDLYCKLWQV